MTILYLIFWISIGIIFYNYIGYGILLSAIGFFKRLFIKKKGLPLIMSDEELPKVTLVVAAYNEAKIIEAKIKDCLQLDYPSDKLEIIFVTDGSDDGTPDIVKRYSDIRLLHLPMRSGKTAALNRTINYISHPIVVFCDANTVVCKKALRKMVVHYKNPKTGGVSGEKRIWVQNNVTAVANESLYWKYESYLKKLDAQLYTVIGAAGELFSIRTSLWEPMEPEVILDDFVLSLRVNLKGFRMAYEPEAYAMELPSASIKEEKKRKVRISAGAFQSMQLLSPVFNVFKYPVLFFQFFSHRLLRWTLTPLCLPLLLFSNLLLVLYFPVNSFYMVVLYAQTAFYALAVLGCFPQTGILFQLGKICRYILFMNYAIYLGFARFLNGTHSVLWQKADREMLVNRPAA